jgi:hypothetical protein
MAGPCSFKELYFPESRFSPYRGYPIEFVMHGSVAAHEKGAVYCSVQVLACVAVAVTIDGGKTWLDFPHTAPL